MYYPWTTHVLPMYYPCITHVFPMYYPCITHVLPMYYPCIIHPSIDPSIHRSIHPSMCHHVSICCIYALNIRTSNLEAIYDLPAEQWSQPADHQLLRGWRWVPSHVLFVSGFTSSTAQGGGGSFKNKKPIGEVGCCESGMAERSHCWIERCLISLALSLSFSDYLPTYLSIFYVSIYLSI